MARLGTVTLIFLVMFASFSTCLEGRKLLDMKEEEKKTAGHFSLPKNLFLSALPKGPVPPSAPSKKGHQEVIDEKLIARHLASLDRILRSVPSPGVGH